MKVGCICGFGVKSCNKCNGTGLMDVSPAELVSQADFEEYEAVRESGVTNMFNTRGIMEFTSLTADKIKAIRSNYDLFAEMYKTKGVCDGCR